MTIDKLVEKQKWSKIGFVLLATMLLKALILPTLIFKLYGTFTIDPNANIAINMLFTILSMYITKLLISPIPIVADIVKEKVSYKELIICYFMLYLMVVPHMIFNSMLETVIPNFKAVTAIESSGTFSSQTMLYIFFVCVFIPFFEEYILRNLVLKRLQHYGNYVAIIITAIMFSIGHSNIAMLIVQFWIGLLLGYIAIRSGSYFYSFLLHALYNLSTEFMGNKIFLILTTALAVLALGIFVKNKMYIIKPDRAVSCKNTIKALKEAALLFFINPGMASYYLVVFFVMYNTFLMQIS